MVSEAEKQAEFERLIKVQREAAAKVKQATPVDPELEGLSSFQEDDPETHRAFDRNPSEGD